MDQKFTTTEFSAHLSRSRMARYLQHQLTSQEVKEVELHLMHCERCSEGILQYIQAEELHNYKIYQKQLKGKLKSKETAKKNKLSKTHLKMLRATAALVLLFVFSFFAVDTVMNKKVADREQPKVQIRAKKDANLKKPNTSLPKEQKINGNSTPEPAAHKKDNNPMLAMQNQSAKNSISSQEKTSTVSRTMPKSAPGTSQQNSASSVAKTEETKTLLTSSAKEEQPIKQINNKQPSQVEMPQYEEDMEEKPVIQPLPRIEKLDIQKTEKQSNTGMEAPAISAPGEAKLLLEK